MMARSDIALRTTVPNTLGINWLNRLVQHVFLIQIIWICEAHSEM